MDLLNNNLTIPRGNKYKQNLNWTDVPHPQQILITKPEVQLIAKETIRKIFTELLHTSNPSKITQRKVFTKSTNEKYLHEKYFKLWKNIVETRRERRRNLEHAKQQKDKIDFFIHELKKRKTTVQTLTNQSKNINKTNLHTGNNYRSRYEAQKSIIELQKAKLEEQNRIIKELKLGQLCADLEKSRVKINIREIFANCSRQLKHKIPLVMKEESKFSIDTRKVPKIIQLVEQKSLERAEKRRIILERKQQIEEARQKMIEKAMEEKRAVEEEGIKKQLELMKERRRKELEMEKTRRRNQQIYAEKFNKATKFYNSLLLNFCFHKLYRNVQKRRDNEQLAAYHYKRNLLKKCLTSWMQLIEDHHKAQYNKAVDHYQENILRKTIIHWCMFHQEYVLNYQVAEDLYDFKLLSNAFTKWKQYMIDQIMDKRKRELLELENRKTEPAERTLGFLLGIKSM
ncbi:unnamed protein product, partial [Phyllotreta striolata]